MKAKLFLAVLLVVAFCVAYACDSNDNDKQLSGWSTPEKLGAPVNSDDVDSCVSISKDGLSLFFSSNRDDVGQFRRDLYVSERASTATSWGDPEPLTDLNNIGDWESCPALSLDEDRLYFTQYPSTCGNRDIWVSQRHSRLDNIIGWEPPVNLGCDADGYVNGPGPDLMPTLFEDEAGTVVMYFGSKRPGSEGLDIYASEMRHDDTFGPATPVAELNSEYKDGPVAVRRDGLEVIFGMNRPWSEGTGNLDLWMATRESTFDPWSEPVPVEALNSAFDEGGKMSFSFDGTELYFARSDPDPVAGVADLYVARRVKLPGFN